VKPTRLNLALAATLGSLFIAQAPAQEPALQHAKALQPMLDNRFSAGFIAAYGTTNWSMLSAYCQGDSSCLETMSASTPVGAKDDGFAWGLKLGYQIVENFGVEMMYQRFHDSEIHFGRWSFYDRLPANVPSTVHSSVYAYSLMAKFFAPMFGSRYYAYAEAGPTVTHRKDLLTHGAHINLSFGVGIGRVFWNRLQTELAIFYSTGFDHSTITPADTYMPFLLSVGAKIAYRFSL
jgi:hypothetical protein